VNLPHFAQPLCLLFFLLLPLVLWRWFRQGRTALRFSDVRPLQALPRGRSAVAHWGGLVLRGLALGSLIVAMAGPRWPDLGTRIPTEGIAIVIALDVSGSMGERDFTWGNAPVSRLEAVKLALHLFVEGGEGVGGERLEGRKHDLLGLVTFATRPESLCPLTLSHNVLLKLLDGEQARTVPDEGRTNIGDGIAWALYRLKAAGNRRKVIVLLTDGEHNVDELGPAKEKALRPKQAAQLAANLNIPIYTIDAGSDAPPKEGAAVEEGSAADRITAVKTLQEVARMTKGQYFRASDTKMLLEVCGQIDRLERREIETFLYRRYAEGYPWFGLAGFVLLMAVQLLELTFWRRLP
jgi:Ca-activated chloride channel family protein